MVAWFIDFEEDKHNEQFEEFILRWEDEFAEREHDCAFQKQQGDSKFIPPYQKQYQRKSKDDMFRIFGHPQDWLGTADFSVYHLQPTVYYYGYEGSITVPPCTRDVVWRVLDLPMQISHAQYLRLQHLILDQRDDKCKRNSKANEHGGINRPIQKNSYRVWHCNGRMWRPRFGELFCNVWPKNYHGAFRLRRVCPGF